MAKQKGSLLSKRGSATILTDEGEKALVNPNNEFSFDEYCNSIIKIVNGPHQRCCIGIYGEWGTGKTTLMRLIERTLKPTIFCWEKATTDDESHLKDYLISNYEILEWIKNEKIEENNSNKNLLTIKEKETSDLNNINNSPKNLEIELFKNKKNATLTFNNNKIVFLAEEGSLEECPSSKIKYDESVEKSNQNEIENDDTKMHIHIKENNILTIWFNAWRYEKEEKYAIKPLIKTIAYAMGEHPFYKDIKPILLKGVEILSKDIIRNLAAKYLLTSKGIEEFEKQLNPKLKWLPEIEKDTIYYDGLKKLEEKIKEIYKENPYCKIVVFIDDLDRCSPETAVEVFESIKIFLDIEGFVFIVGLGKKMLEKMISVKLEKAGLKDVEAQEYLRKIIQLEINIPDWNNDSISVLLKEYQTKLNKDHINVISGNEDLILKAVKKNPRRTKRFINNFIIESSTKDINARTYFLREVVADTWVKVYDNLRDNNEFRQKIKGYIDLSRDERIDSFKPIREEKQKGKNSLSKVDEEILSVDDTFWDFIEKGKNKQSFKEMIDQWDKYNSVGESVKELDIVSSNYSLDRETAMQLLSSGKIEEFNKKRQIDIPLNLNKFNLSHAHLSSARLTYADLIEANLTRADLLQSNLSYANLSYANLSYANLTGARLLQTNLTDANLTDANFTGADISYANLTDANFTGARLTDADLSYANLIEANLSYARLRNTNLSYANLSGANLSYARLSGANLENSILLNLIDSNIEKFYIDDKTSFSNAITDSKEIVNYLENQIPKENMPILFTNKEDLKKELENRGYILKWLIL